MSERPHCKNVGACIAKTLGKHCPPCAAGTPEVRARKAAACQLAMLDPEKRARKSAAARRVAADPVITARKREAMLAAHSTEETKARHRKGCKAAAIRRLQDPSERAKLVELGKTVGARNFHLANTDAAKVKRGRTIRAKHLAWCPEEFWALNEKLRRRRVLLDDRQRIISRMIAERDLRVSERHQAAADFLRKYTSVSRCDGEGSLNPIGTHWRYGTRVMDRLDTVQLALSKGWAPDRMAA